MTIDEAKQIIDKEIDIAIDDLTYMTDDLFKALRVASKALEQQPCEDCISRPYIEPIVEELENICINGNEHILSLLSDIKNAPSVTPKTKIGQWIEEKNDYGEITHWHCSKCYDDSGFITTCKWDYCPNCGAKMEVKE